MARAKIAAHFIKEYEKALTHAVQYIGNSAGSRLYDCTFRISEVANQMEYAIKAIIKDPLEEAKRNKTKDEIFWMYAEATATTANFEKVCKDVFKSLKAGGMFSPWSSAGKAGFRKDGTYVLGKTRGGAGITFRFVRAGSGSTKPGKGIGGMFGADDKQVQRVIAHVRDLLYHAWIDKYAENIAKDLKYEGRSKHVPASKKIPKTKQSGYTEDDKRFGQPGQPATRKKIFTDHLEAAHEPGSELGVQGLRWLRLQSPPVDFPFGIEMHDITNQIAENLGVEIGRKSWKTKIGGYFWEFVGRTSIRYNETGSETGDISNIKGKELQKAINQVILKNPWKHRKLFFISGSTRPVDQVVDDTIRDIIRPLTKAGKLDRRFKINRQPKKFKPTNDKAIKIKKPKKAKSRIGRGVAAALGKKTAFKVRTDKQVEKGAGRAASTQNAAELAMTKKYIQGRLPAEVRRNMGRPQLISRTGQFSESVKLISLTPAANTVVAKYTYTLSGGGNSKNRSGVYSTFENSGRWPQAYNPKPLISKSIRKLALGRIEQKLTTRRV